MRMTPGTVSESGWFPFSVDRDSIGPMAKCVEDLVNMMDIMATKSHPMVPANGYGKGKPRTWSDISIAILNPHHWCLSEDVQKPQPGALDHIVRSPKHDMF
jgi:Asp-tRNA(Asn)/Glu-tRNA(Gln) amidotransferase A subunit family amidase